MAIHKGDLVKIDTSLINESEITQDLLESILKIPKEEMLLVTTSPYEKQLPQIVQLYANHSPFIFNSITICVDLILKNKFYKGVPTKYLKRIT